MMQILKMWARWTNVLMGLGLLLGCRTVPTAPPDGGGTGERAFFSPEGIAASERYVLVANTAHSLNKGKSEYSQGFISIIDRQTRQLVGRVMSSQLNPQDLVLRGQKAYVLNSGEVSLQTNGVVGSTSGGGIDIIDLGQGVPRTVEANIPLGWDPQDPRGGGAASLVISPLGNLAYLASGTRGDLYKVDLAARKVIRGPENPLFIFPLPGSANDMTVIRPWGQGVVMINYNTEQLCTSTDWEGDFSRRECGSIRLQQQLMAGPWDVVQAPDEQALVLMSLANSVAQIDLSQDPFIMEQGFASTGLAANRMVVDGTHLFIVNSLSNNLQRVDLSTRESVLPFAVFPLGSNPYSLAITREPTDDLAWVTLFKSHQVAVIKLATGEVLELLAAESLNVDGGGLSDGAMDGAADTKGAQDHGIDGVAERVVGVHALVSASYGTGAGYGQAQLPGVIQGGPQGGGQMGQGTDVLSLGVGGEIILDFGDHNIVDGPGVDFIVFENPYLPAPYSPFAEPAHVAVSVTGFAPQDFQEFPCDLSVIEGDPVTQTWPFPGCAGVHPVYANVKANAISASDSLSAGGDAFDLADLGLQRAKYLRLRDAGISLMGPDNKGFDLDAVVLIHHSSN